MKWMTTPYFEYERPLKHPEVSKFHAVQVAEDFVREKIQADGRIRRWGYVAELGKYIRVIIEADGRTLHNAFVDGRFRP